MQVKCPICHNEGNLQQRYHSVRVGHYKGFKKSTTKGHGHTTIIEWHSTNIQTVLLVNKGKLGLDEHGKLYSLFTQNEEKDRCLPRSPQTHNLENNNGA
jgi:tRNA(Phe) wybutosine-synthesizing methylase Tyw3